MRVAINAWFWDSPTTGSGQYVQRLVESLAALNADLQIILVTPDNQRQEAGSRKQEARRAGLRRAEVRASLTKIHTSPGRV